jgi:Fe-S-cluster containining protein
LTKQLPVIASDNTEFSYTCNACSRCCYDKRIVVNPYELLRLARNRSISTTELIAEFTEHGGTTLKVQPNGACVFLGDAGCTVHADRPLVCRLYPLGRIVQADGTASYVECEPHPETAGLYGNEGTIADYVKSQGATPYIAANERYYTLLVKLTRAFAALDEVSTVENGEKLAALEIESARFVDVDAIVKDECERTGELFPSDIESLVGRHLQLLERWADQSPTPY